MIDFFVKGQYDQGFYRPTRMVGTTRWEAGCINLADRTYQEGFDISFL